MKSIIAIDGPAGAGKSTVAKRVAEQLGYIYIDTGAMYRAVAWKTLRSGEEVTDAAILRAAADIDVRLSCTDGGTRVTVDGADVTGEIRTPEVTGIVSRVAALAPVRAKMVDLQRAMAGAGKVVMDGRDIATNVEERARRRHKEMQEKGFDVDLAELQKEIAARDKQDSEREISPLRQADDAILIDSTGLSIEEVTARILALCA